MTTASASDFDCLVPENRWIRLPEGWIGKKVHVTVGRKKRGLDANAWMWGVAYAKYLAPELGYESNELEEMHDGIIMAMYGSKLCKITGNQVPKVRTSKMNTKEFSEHMEALVRWAAKTANCVIPLPNEAA